MSIVSDDSKNSDEMEILVLKKILLNGFYYLWDRVDGLQDAFDVALYRHLVFFCEELAY
jgi:hypothetical protein